MTTFDRQHTLASVAVLIGLSGIIVTHVLDLPGKLSETPYLGVLYIGLIIAAVVLMQRIITKGDRTTFLASAALGALVLLGYIVNRTVGMPGATDDIGNWLEPLGIVAILSEVLVIWQGLSGARRRTAVTTAATPVRESVSVR